MRQVSTSAILLSVLSGPIGGSDAYLQAVAVHGDILSSRGDVNNVEGQVDSVSSAVDFDIASAMLAEVVPNAAVPMMEGQGNGTATVHEREYGDDIMATDDDEEDDEEEDEEEDEEDDDEGEDERESTWTINPALWEAIWDSGDLRWFAEYIGCPESDSEGSEDPDSFSHIPTAESNWNILYEAYHAVVPKELASIPLDGYRGGSFTFPVEVRAIPFMGRGVFSTSFIPEGSLVWKPLNAAEFPSRKHYENFYLYLLKRVMESENSEDFESNGAQKVSVEVMCDALMWSYTEIAEYGDVESRNRYILCIDFDEGSMINEYSRGFNKQNLQERSREFYDDGSEIVGCQEGSLYAIRDIHPGEGTCLVLMGFVSNESSIFPDWFSHRVLCLCCRCSIHRTSYGL
jgi:hypothetical protein